MDIHPLKEVITIKTLIHFVYKFLYIIGTSLKYADIGTVKQISVTVRRLKP